jgi:single-strand DNA-binding protein
MSLPTVAGNAKVISDVALRTGKSGKPWLLITVAFEQMRQDDAGTWVKSDDFICQAVAFGRLAENVAASVAKFDEIHISGCLKTSRWTDQAGAEQARPQLVADHIGLSLRWTPAKAARKPRQQPASDTGRRLAAVPRNAA